MKHRIFMPITACAAALWLCLIPGVLAAPPPPAAPAPPALNLSPAQQQKLTALETASRAEASQLFGQIRQLRSKLSDLYHAYTLDANEARRLNGELNRVQGQLLDLHLSEQQGLRGILSADQFAQLQATVKQRHGDWGDHPHDHGGHH